MSKEGRFMRLWGSRLPDPRVSLFVLSGLGLLGFRLFTLIDLHSVNVLFWDQWDFYEPLFEGQGTWDLFRFQHGPHRQGVGFWLTALVAHFSSWDTRADAFALGGVIVLAALLAVGLRQRLTGELHFADIAIALVVLTPAQYGIFINTPNASHGAVPLLLIVLYGYALTLRADKSRFATLLLLNFCLINTGFGIFAGLLTPLYFAWECLLARRREPGRWPGLPLLGVAIALASGAHFFVGYEFHDSEVALASLGSDAIHFPSYVALMLANVCGVKGLGLVPQCVGFAVLGAALWVLGIRGCAILRGSSSEQDRVIAFWIAFTLLFCLNVAVGRVSLGMPGAQSTRYVPLVVPLFLGIHFHIQAMAVRPLRHLLAGLMVLGLIAATFPMREAEHSLMVRLKIRKERWAEVYRVSHNIKAADQNSRIRIYPWAPERTQLQEKLDILEERQLNLFRPDSN